MAAEGTVVAGAALRTDHPADRHAALLADGLTRLHGSPAERAPPRKRRPLDYTLLLLDLLLGLV